MNIDKYNMLDNDYRCKCCLEGSDLKNMWEEYNCNGEREIYGEMLTDCFSLNWHHPREPLPVEQICQSCVIKLRDAASFKKIILHSQQLLIEQLEKASKYEVKLEKDDSETEMDTDFLSVGYHDDDTKKTQDPLPIDNDKKDFTDVKIELETLERTRKIELKLINKKLIKYTDEDFQMCMEAVRNKTMSQVKASTTFKVPVRTIRKALRNIPVNPEEPVKKLSKPRLDIQKQQENLDCLLKNSNVTPIRGFFGRGYGCYFCQKKYEQPRNLKEHTLIDHGGDKFERLQVLRDYNIKVDVTDLKCTICDESINTLDDIWEHFVLVHEKIIHRDSKIQVVPFKFNDSEILKCVVCSDEYKSFKLLNDHMNMRHFKNYECEKCGRGFISRRTLRAHSYRHGNGETFPCQFCSKTFPTKIRRREHEKWVHLCEDKRLKCGYCDEKFTHAGQKDNHEVKVHGAKESTYKCQACNKVFRSKKSVRVHVNAYHLMLRTHQCSECDMSFFQKTQLDMHMIKHTGVREFKCSVCLKSYGRKSTLREHMRIHENDRRFQCAHCSMAFIQKCSWRSHVRSAHGDTV